ncbi:hypothetical protein L596_001041 [Steinernema carpocapsae]|uniref:Uncharacterized protein n=1 Tax=Steinernema carpocapsae TaxID=34508 RepID=A0A4U8UK95_STECR|nr:hypothetical protein L596_001041 [Steinernema carpocapsae]
MDTETKIAWMKLIPHRGYSIGVKLLEFIGPPSGRKNPKNSLISDDAEMQFAIWVEHGGALASQALKNLAMHPAP